MKNVKRIGYAPSIADPWPKSRWEEFKGYLSHMDIISVREKSDVPVVEKLSGKPVTHVVDPILEDKRVLGQPLAGHEHQGTLYLLLFPWYK